MSDPLWIRSKLLGTASVLRGDAGLHHSSTLRMHRLMFYTSLRSEHAHAQFIILVLVYA